MGNKRSAKLYKKKTGENRTSVVRIETGNEHQKPLFVILSLSAVLRIPNLTESLWYDELWYTFQFLNSSDISRVLFHDVHPPLYPLIMLVWINLFGDSEVAVRLPSLIFGILSIGVLYLLAKEWFDGKTAVLSAVLMSLSPVHIWYSQENKTNMLLMLLTLLTVYALNKAWRRDRNFYWCLFVATAVLSLYANVFTLWIIASIFLWIACKVFFGSYKRYLNKAILSGAAIALLYLPQVIHMMSHAEDLTRNYLRPFSPQEIYRLFLIYLSHGNTIRTISPYSDISRMFTQSWLYFLVDFFFGVLILYGIARLAIRVPHNHDQYKNNASIDLKPDHDLLLFYFIAPPLLLMAASLFNRHIYIERSMIIMLPPFLLILAHAAFSLPSRKMAAFIVGILILFNIWALYNLWIGKSNEWTVYKQNPDWESTAGYFHSELEKGTGKFVIFRTTPADALKYYHRRFMDEQQVDRRRAYPKNLPIRRLSDYRKNEFDTFLSKNSMLTFYMIHNKYWPGNFQKIFKKITQEKKYSLIGKSFYKGIEIFKFKVSVQKLQG